MPNGPVDWGDEAHEVETRVWSVDEAHHGQRLDKVLVAGVPEFSRSHLQALIEAGHVGVEGEAARVASRKVRYGQSISIRLEPTEQAMAFRPEAMPLPIVFEDADLLVVDKPVGWVVHPAPGHWTGTLLNGLLAHHAGAAALPRAGIVHRLDKDTSGLMVVAKSLAAHHALTQAIAQRRVHRRYWALAHGRVLDDLQEVQAAVGRDPASRIRMAVVPVAAGGKPSRTTVRVLGRLQHRVTAIECTLHTGRTHQIRVHLAHLGHPLLGDSTYGGRPDLGLVRQALHARFLAFDHPIDGRTLSFESVLPDDLAQAWRQLEIRHDANAIE